MFSKSVLVYALLATILISLYASAVGSEILMSGTLLIVWGVLWVVVVVVCGSRSTNSESLSLGIENGGVLVVGGVTGDNKVGKVKIGVELGDELGDALGVASNVGE